MRASCPIGASSAGRDTLGFASTEVSLGRFNDLRFLVAVLSDLNASSCLLKLFFSNRSRRSCPRSITRSFFMPTHSLIERLLGDKLSRWVVRIGDVLKVQGNAVRRAKCRECTSSVSRARIATTLLSDRCSAVPQKILLCRRAGGFPDVQPLFEAAIIALFSRCQLLSRSRAADTGEFPNHPAAVMTQHQHRPGDGESDAEQA